jgi:hypothetical protein
MATIAMPAPSATRPPDQMYAMAMLDPDEVGQEIAADDRHEKPEHD